MFNPNESLLSFLSSSIYSWRGIPFVYGNIIKQPIAIPPVTVNIIIGFIELYMKILRRTGMKVEAREPTEDIIPKASPLTLAGNI